MSAATAATTRNERLVYFPAGDETLFGIFTHPTHDAHGVAVIGLPGGGGGNTNRNGIAVRLCRRLASEGYHCLRFDYHGIGESTGVIEEFTVAKPFTEDLAGAVDWVRSEGIDKVVLFGNCFGARTALSHAPDMEGLGGVVLASPGPRDFAMGDRVTTRLAIEWSLWDYVVKGLRVQTVRDLFDPKERSKMLRAVRAKWSSLRDRVRNKLGLPGERDRRLEPISPLFLDPLERLVERKVPVLFIYGEDDDFYHEFQRARSGRLGGVLARAGSLVEVRTLPGEIHGFARTGAQEPVIEVVSQWLEQRFGRPAQGSDPSASWQVGSSNGDERATLAAPPQDRQTTS